MSVPVLCVWFVIFPTIFFFFVYCSNFDLIGIHIVCFCVSTVKRLLFGLADIFPPGWQCVYRTYRYKHTQNKNYFSDLVSFFFFLLLLVLLFCWPPRDECSIDSHLNGFDTFVCRFIWCQCILCVFVCAPATIMLHNVWCTWGSVIVAICWHSFKFSLLANLLAAAFVLLQSVWFGCVQREKWCIFYEIRIKIRVRNIIIESRERERNAIQ